MRNMNKTKTNGILNHYSCGAKVFNYKKHNFHSMIQDKKLSVYHNEFKFYSLL